MLQKFLGIKYIHERKLIHKCALEILILTADALSGLSAEEVVESRVVPALFQSIQHGIIEFFRIGKANVDVMSAAIDGKAKFVETYAIECRQEKYFHELSTREGHFLAAWTDDDGNNALHIAAKLGPESYLAQFSDPRNKVYFKISYLRRKKEKSCWVRKNPMTVRFKSNDYWVRKNPTIVGFELSKAFEPSSYWVQRDPIVPAGFQVLGSASLLRLWDLK
ncbi:hypothetical protein SLEP1_g44170 [Rubroshorea leprosula]|uniref:Uncharacterized protein n=1 Tax=Rubroshorea leprosula TaxID=152421 RepID=A0AAV5LFF8_9ROSI|nr:hypothetical protein SLEP1_g44170 [Rubroshorea leprosula]